MAKPLNKNTIRRMNDRNTVFGKPKQAPRPSYFDNQEQRLGASWLMKKTGDDMRREVKAIIRDLVRMNIDINLHGHYFTETLIISNLIRECEEQYRRYQGMSEMANVYFRYGQMIGVVPHPQYAAIKHEVEIVSSMYYALLNTFYQINATQDAGGHLFNLYNILEKSDARNFIDDDVPTFVRETFMDN